MRPLQNWDQAYLNNEIIPADESSWLEKKAETLWQLNSGGEIEGRCRQELAKQICAFSNAGDGFVVYGIDKSKRLDAGVPLAVGRTPIKEFVEGYIPQLCYPPILGCTATTIQVSGHHAADRAVLVLSIPLSESRPHWSSVCNEEVAYIRAGEHSAPMRLQTLLDISARGSTWHGEIVAANPIRSPSKRNGCTTHHLLPKVRLLSGPVCERWGFELSVVSGNVELYADHYDGTHDDEKMRVYYLGSEPLFPHRMTYVPTSIQVSVADGSAEIALMATLYLGSGRPIERLLGLADLLEGSAGQPRKEPPILMG
jgi:schlafen family protein